MSLVEKINKSKINSVDEVGQRAKRGVSAFIKSMLADGKSQEAIISSIADGTAARGYRPHRPECL